MTKKKQPPIKEDDPAQSEAFRRAALELEAEGGLNPNEAAKVVESVVKNAKMAKPGE